MFAGCHSRDAARNRWHEEQLAKAHSAATTHGYAQRRATDALADLA